jgi:hypothetical protein
MPLGDAVRIRSSVNCEPEGSQGGLHSHVRPSHPRSASSIALDFADGGSG